MDINTLICIITVTCIICYTVYEIACRLIEGVYYDPEFDDDGDDIWEAVPEEADIPSVFVEEESNIVPFKKEDAA